MTPIETARAELHWLLTAPSLLRAPAGVEDGSALLATLAEDPSSLQRAAAQLARQPRPQRLGHHFENLVASALGQHPRFEIVARNVPLRQGADTLGELDLLVRDHSDGALCHWELALKFYLGLPGETLPRGWPGPDPRDQLADKATHLFDQQLTRSEQPVVKSLLAARGWTVQRRVLLTRGRLFYPCQGTPPVCPWLHSGHQRGIWRYAGEQSAQPPAVPHHLWHLPELFDRNRATDPHDQRADAPSSLPPQRPVMTVEQHQQVVFLMPPAWPGPRHVPS